MSSKKSSTSRPRRHRMRRPVRLVSARAWIASWALAGRQVRAGDYAARYGVDRCTAYREMVMLDVPIAPGDARYAVPPPPRPRVRRLTPRPIQGPAADDMDEVLCPGEAGSLWGEPW